MVTVTTVVMVIVVVIIMTAMHLDMKHFNTLPFTILGCMEASRVLV
jgi:hypothetical protein